MDKASLKDAARLIFGDRINVVCRAAGNYAGRKISFADGWFEIEGDTAAGELECMATFKLGDDADTAMIGDQTGREAVERAVSYLRTVADKRLRESLKNGSLVMLGRKDAPDVSDKAVDHVTFESFVIEDWRRGIARTTDGAHRLFALSIGADIEVTATAAGEQRTILVAARLLRNDPHLTKPALKSRLKDMGHEFSDTGFKNRIWVSARQAAGLPQEGRPGRRPTQKRNQ